MLVCATCRQEMTCEKTGLGARYGSDHVYPGDAFICPGCAAFIIRTNDVPVHDPNNNISTIQMKEK